ncbi:MAG: 5-methyltetrahydropteroyltriglutamate--homocysteine methyltransferase [Solirubrobacteraceae bacterium]
MGAIPTSLVGSYPQPEWLIDRDALRSRLPPRVRARELWKVDPRWLAEAQDDAVRIAIADQERAGLSVITDGEMRRESYSNQFANALEGIDHERPGTIVSRAGTPASVPRVTGPLARRHPVGVDELRFLRAHTSRPVKVTVPGPFTMSQQAVDEHYGDELAFALAYADVVRAEALDLFAAGADVVQLDEPWLESRAGAARRLAVLTLTRALKDLPGTTAVHLCFGYPAFVPDHPPAYDFLAELAAVPVDQISIESAQSGVDLAVLEALPGITPIVGVIALHDDVPESPELVAERLARALAHTDTLIAAPDCGMKYLSRDLAYAKLEALVAGAALVSSR